MYNVFTKTDGCLGELYPNGEVPILPWVEYGSARKEFWHSSKGTSYTYGTKPFERTYESQPLNAELISVIHWLNYSLESLSLPLVFDSPTGIFINYYENERNSLGWHSDDSEEIDHSKPIYVLSIGATRDIMFKTINGLDEKRLELVNGSLLVMEAGCQQTHLHRIPKVGHRVGPRVSLTFRFLK